MNENNSQNNMNNNQIEELEPTVDSSIQNPIVQEASPTVSIEPVQPQAEPQIPSGMIEQVNNQEEPQIIATYDQTTSAPQETLQPNPTNNVVVEPPEENIQETQTNPIPPIVNNNATEVTPTEYAPQPAFSMEPDPNIKLDDEEEPDQKKKTPKALIIGIAILALLAVLFFLYISIFQNKKVIIQKEITTVFDTFIKSVKEVDSKKLDIDFEKDILGIEGSLNISSNYKSSELDLSKLKDYSLKYNGVLDKKNNKLSGNISLNKDNPLLSANLFVNGKSILLQSEQLYSKIMKTTLEKELKDYDFNNTLDTNKIIKLLEKTRNIVKNSVDDKNIEKSSVTKEINGKKQSVNKISYRLDLNQLEKDILNGYLKDEECLKLLADLSGEKVTDIKEELSDALKNTSNEKNEILIESYHNKFTSSLKLVDIIKENKSFDNSKNTTVISITKNSNNDLISLKNNDKEILSGTYDKKKEELILKASEEGVGVEFVLKKVKEDTYSISVDVTINDTHYSAAATFENKKTNNSIENNVKVSINFALAGENITADITSTSKIAKSGTIKELEESSAVDIDSITEEDYYQIQNNLYEKLQTIIMDIMPGLVESMNSYSTNEY